MKLSFFIRVAPKCDETHARKSSLIVHSWLRRDEYPQNAEKNADMAAINAILEESTPEERAETYKAGSLPAK